jgi:hypothetical protein
MGIGYLIVRESFEWLSLHIASAASAYLVAYVALFATAKLRLSEQVIRVVSLSIIGKEDKSTSRLSTALYIAFICIQELEAAISHIPETGRPYPDNFIVALRGFTSCVFY